MLYKLICRAEQQCLVFSRSYWYDSFLCSVFISHEEVLEFVRIFFDANERMRDSSKNVLFLFNSYNTWNKYKSAGIKYLDFTDRFVLKYFGGQKYMWWPFLLERDTKTGFLVFYCVESEKRSFYAVKYRDPSPRYQGLFCVGSESVLNMMEDIKSFVQKLVSFCIL